MRLKPSRMHLQYKNLTSSQWQELGLLVSINIKSDTQNTWTGVGSHDRREFGYIKFPAFKIIPHQLLEKFGFFQGIRLDNGGMDRPALHLFLHLLKHVLHALAGRARFCQGLCLSIDYTEDGFELQDAAKQPSEFLGAPAPLEAH